MRYANGIVLNLGYAEESRYAVLPFWWEGESADCYSAIWHFCTMMTAYLDALGCQFGYERPTPEEKRENPEGMKAFYEDMLEHFMRGNFQDDWEVQIEGVSYSFWEWSFESHGWKPGVVPKHLVFLDRAAEGLAYFDPDTHSDEYLRAAFETGELCEGDEFLRYLRAYAELPKDIEPFWGVGGS